MGATDPVVIRLPYRPPFAAAPLVRNLHAHAVPGMEIAHDDGRLTRVMRAPGGPALVTVDLQSDAVAVLATLELTDPRDRDAVVATIRLWLDLDTDTAPIAASLAGDPLLAPLVAARPGVRVLGAIDGFETGITTILGQQVSLAAARTFAGRLVRAFGEPAPGGLATFPDAATLAAAGPDAVREAAGITGARGRTIHGLAEAVAGGLTLHPGADVEGTRARLLALPGIGAWTADYLAVRVLGDRDSFPAGDLVLRRAMGVRTAREAEVRAESWRPWRAYALLHLWTGAVFS